MAQPSNVVNLKCSGLQIQPNFLGLKPGALVEAINVVIDRDNLIESRRGFSIYGNVMGVSPSTDNAKALLNYKGRILRHFGSTFQYDNGSGTFTSFSGSISETQSGLRIKGLQSANGNFYFTTSNGIKKISVANASDLTTSSVTNAGGIKALDGVAKLNTTTGFFTQDSVTAYRIVWGIKDANQNIILGTPSERIVIYNSITDLLIPDFNYLLQQLDTLSDEGGIDDQDYLEELKITKYSAAEDVKYKIFNLCEKLDDDVVITEGAIDVTGVSITSNIASIVFDTDVSDFLEVGDVVKFTNFGGSAAILNGTFTLTDVSTTTVQFVHSTASLGSITSGDATAGVCQRLKYTIGDFKVNESLNIPISIAGVTVINNIVYVRFAGDISSYLAVKDNITFSGFLSTFADLNGTHNILSLFGASSNVIAFSKVRATVGSEDTSTNVTGSNATLEASTYSLNLRDVPSTEQLEELQEFFNNIVDNLQIEPEDIIASNPTAFDDANITSSATVDLTFTVPDGVTTAHFYQIYRTPLTTSSGVSSLFDSGIGEAFDPGDECKLAYEGNPTEGDIAGKSISYHDITPDSFLGANLYINPQSGEGILKANEIPPLAKDIAAYKDYTFYANTSTKHRKNISLLSVENFVTNTSKLIITDGTTLNTYTFVSGVKHKIKITCVPGGDYGVIGVADYFDVYSLDKQYRVYFDTGAITPPNAPSNGYLIPVSIAGTETNAEVATLVYNELNKYDDFIIEAPVSEELTIENSDAGVLVNSPSEDVGDGSFTIDTLTYGAGEDPDTNKVVFTPTSVDPNITPSQQVDETARSLVRIINKNSSSLVIAQYLSGSGDVPGFILLENKTLSGNKFYLLANSASTGASFTPDLSPQGTITSITVADPTVVTSASHGLVTGDQILILDSNSTPSLNGVKTVTRLNSDDFTIDIEVTVGGNAGVWKQVSKLEASDNEVKINRLYYSKFQQPEAVPLLNYRDIGSGDKAILRILPLRDSLFIFKEDSIWRLSSETEPFIVALADNSAALQAADSAVVLNNEIYFFSEQGIAKCSETGVSVMSRDIETPLLKLVSPNYPHFSTATWGINYESDRSYYLFTVKNTSDTKATQCFRYNTFTNSWTVLTLAKTCGIVNTADDKLYLGASDTNYIEQERKNFNRTDYCDRETTNTIPSGGLSGRTITFGSLENAYAGDVLVQKQYLTINQFNKLLKKLDRDDGVADTNYYSLLAVEPGDDLSIALSDLCDKLNADGGIADSDYSSSGSNVFTVLQSDFNAIIEKLNNDAGVADVNYQPVSGYISFEVPISQVNTSGNAITLLKSYPLIIGVVSIFNHIPVSIVWAPEYFGNVNISKQIREAKILFQNDAFTKGVITFSSDLSAIREDFEFDGSGVGSYGSGTYGERHYGGSGSAAPFRTLVPLEKQRCKYLKMGFKHQIAREKFIILGTAMTGTVMSERSFE